MAGGDEGEGQRGEATPPGTGGGLARIDLELLEDNPYQPRTRVDEEALEALCASIAQSGLLQPIAVRPRPSGRYQIVAGHRRVTAFRRLRERARSEEERRRYQRVPSLVLPELTEAQLAVSAFVENGQRQDLDLLEEANALARIRQLLPAPPGHEASAREVAAAVGYDEKRVRRLLQLHHAPQVVKDGVAGPPAPGGGGGAPREEPPARLNLMTAIELTRLHKHFAERDPARADERTRQALSRALRERWGLRRVQSYVEGILSRRGGGARGPEPSLLRRSERELVIRTAKLSRAGPAALQDLRGALKELLALVEERLARLGQPPGP